MTTSERLASDPEAARLAAVRAEVVRTSGWGSTFRFFQPRNLAFWVYVVIVGYGAYVMTGYYNRNATLYSGVIIFSVIAFGLYAAVFWWFTERIDRYAHQSTKLIVTAFVWGAFGAIIMASFANTPILSLYGKAFGQAWSMDWGAGLTAPFTEEPAKGLGLLLLIALAPRLVASAFDGFILGAFIGLGFQIQEDLNYALGAAGNDFGTQVAKYVGQVTVMRGVTGIGAHILFSSIFCAGMVYLLGRPAQPRRFGLGVLLIATAMLLHGVWDDNAGIFERLGPGVSLLTSVPLLIIAVVVVIRVYHLTVPPEQQFMRAVLAPEVTSGVVTDEELATLAGGRKARRAYKRAGHGAERKRRAHRLHAVHDLADELARSGGQDTTRVAFARTEVERFAPAT